MNLLICTQAVDRSDSILGFFCDWIEEFAKQYEHVTVICLRKGDYAMPPNVTVRTLPPGRVSRALALCYASYSMRKEYGTVFAHMNPEYVVACGWLWRMLRKPIGLWYAHGSVNTKLRIAERFADVIFTPSAESFRIESHKRKIVGHGIDVAQFAGDDEHQGGSLLCVGRISKIKNFDLMFDVLSEVVKTYPHATLSIVGEPLTDADHAYHESLKRRIETEQLPVVFRGVIPHSEIHRVISDADVFLSCSRTGSLDKTVLEAWAGGLYVATTNEGARSAGQAIDPEIPIPEDVQKIASSIDGWFSESEDERSRYRARARAYVRSAHGLSRLIGDISSQLKAIAHNE